VLLRVRVVAAVVRQQPVVVLYQIYLLLPVLVVLE
jgi:hypothetical protein